MPVIRALLAMRTRYTARRRTALRTGPGRRLCDPPAVPAPDSEPPAGRRQWLVDRLGASNERLSTLEPKHPGLRVALRVVFVLLVVGSLTFAIASEAGKIGDFEWRFEPAW